MSHTIGKLAILRAALKDSGIDCYIIPSTDPHLGENIPEHWCVIKWLTGFTGSSATVVVTESFAGLWTDSRYFIQAEEQLRSSGFIVMKPVTSEKNTYREWIADHSKEGSVLALDGRLFSIGEFRRIEQLISGKNITINSSADLITKLWTDRPSLPARNAFDHPVTFCGKERSVKISDVKEQMAALGVDYHLLTSPDDIMWLLNIRGSDYKYSPLMASFALISQDQVLLFTDEDKIPFQLAREFDKLEIVILPYEEVESVISTLNIERSILISPATTSIDIYRSIPEGMEIREEATIPSLMKAVKNKIEIENIGKVMIKDGIALTKLYYWLGNYPDSMVLTEMKIDEKLQSLRAEQDNYLGPSFSAIIAYNAHGALPHYNSTDSTDTVIGREGILLIDSGGQYLDGTTDITRTISLGIPAARQKRDFTLVLKGMIGLAMAKFPYGTRGYQLDLLARKDLWENGINYGHGTGHGVGFCLNVHEGPQNIGPGNGPGSKTVIEPGMLLSNEPAVYREGEYGIRTENLILCYEDEETEFGTFLKFETMTLCYFDKSLIDCKLLDDSEISWLNSYHKEVFDKISVHLEEDERQWLKEKTEMIGHTGISL